MVETVNRTFTYGETVQLDATFTDGDGAALNLAGASIAWKIALADDQAALVTMTIGDGVTIVLAAAGTARLILTPAKQTSFLKTRSYYHEVTVTLADGTVTTQLAGLLTLRDAVGL